MQLGICGHDVAQAQANQVPGHQFARGEGLPAPVPAHPGLERQPLLELLDGVAGLVLLPEPDPRVENQQHQDDDRDRPSAGRWRRGSPPPRSSRGWDPRSSRPACAAGWSSLRLSRWGQSAPGASLPPRRRGHRARFRPHHREGFPIYRFLLAWLRENRVL